MIKVTVIAMGKIKEKYFTAAIDEYAKRMSRYCSFKIVELSPVALVDNPSQSEISAALKKEAALIDKSIPKGDFVTALCVEGKRLTSEELASRVKENCNSGKNMTYIIGSSYGLDEDLKRRADLRLSLSDMTFPHRLFRVMLAEQLYRAFKINEGGSYHK